MRAEYIDHMGSDLTVVNSARVSFDKESEWKEEVQDIIHDEFGTHYKTIKQLKQSDIKLINYLAKHNHFTPFTHCVITMREIVPIFVARQRFKHTVGFTYNEVSRRYVSDTPDIFEFEYLRPAAENLKQGSIDEKHHSSDYWIKRYKHAANRCLSIYEQMIKDGVAPEQARAILPQGSYTSYYVTGSLAAWARAYKLRIDGHAQKEIQDLAKQWDGIISNIKELENSWVALKEN
jgi:thymidylate synthase (FAD)